MIGRFLAIIDSFSEHDVEIRRNLTARISRQFDIPIISEGPAFSVVADSVLPSISLQNGGAILGTLFQGTDGAARLQTLDEASSKAAEGTGGASLISSFWGSYVAILPQADDGGVQIIADPSGTFPCYCLGHQGLTVITSDVRLALEAGFLSGRIDWPNVARHMLADDLRSDRTCIEGATELEPGWRLHVDAKGVVREMLWSPWDHAHRDRWILDEKVAIERLRETILGCVGSLSTGFNHILLGLSGGLDSSIVAAALARQQRSFSCLTLATAQPAGDERHYARAVTDHLGVELFEAIEEVRDVRPEQSSAARLPRPVARSFAQSGDARFMEIAAQIGADAFFGGGGGDNVFCHARSASVIADRFLFSGPGPGALKTMKDMSLMTESSLWAAAKKGIRRAWRPATYRWPLDTRFLSREAVEAHSSLPDHAWLNAPADAFPGKALHIAWILGFRNHLEGFKRERIAPKISPLMSQPVVELCLRIPSWMWCRGGRNRAIAREAFANDLPPLIVLRQSKGSPDRFIQDIFNTNRTIIREMMLEGLLSRQGLLDRPAVERALSASAAVEDHGWFRLMALVDVEAWARSWADAPPSLSIDATVLHAALPSGDIVRP
jgi:asparagine synthase (glutamine-hydrolysing)